MKEVYESPMMVCEAFVATQSVAAGNCVPGVDESKFDDDPITETFSCKLGDTDANHVHDNKHHKVNNQTFTLFVENTSCNFNVKDHTVNESGLYTSEYTTTTTNPGGQHAETHIFTSDKSYMTDGKPNFWAS